MTCNMVPDTLITAADLIDFLQLVPPETPVCVECVKRPDRFYTGPLSDMGTGEVGYIPAAGQVTERKRKDAPPGAWRVLDSLREQNGMIGRQPCVLLRGSD